MNDRRFFIADILAQAAVFVLLITIALPLVSWVAGGAERLYYIYLLAVPFYLLMLFRRLFGSFVSFAVLHALTLASVYLWPVGFYMKIVCAGFMLVSVVYSVADRTSRESGGISPAFLVFIAAVSIAAGRVASSLSIDLPAAYLMFNASAAALCYFMRRHIMDVAFSLEAISLTSSQPVKTIKRFNNAAIVVFLVLASVAAAFSGFIPTAAVLTGLGDLLLKLLRFLFSFAREREPILETPIQQSPVAADPGYGMLPPPNDPFILWVILEKIFMFLTAAAVIAGIVAGVAYLCYKLYKNFYANAEEQSDVKEFIPPEASYEKIAAGLFGFVPAFGVPSQRVRRLFYKKVKRYIKNGLIVKKNQTARDIAAEIKKRENIDELAVMYEKARYRGEDRRV